MGKALGWVVVGLIIINVGMCVTPAVGHNRNIPKCQEDELVQGVGNFENGRWTRYICVHPDDIVAETIENDYRNPAVYATVVGSVCEHKRFWYRQGIETVVTEACH